MSLCPFSFQGQNNFISLMDIHVQNLASLCRICGDEIEDHKRKVVTNRFVSEIHQIWKDLLLLDSPNVHPQLKNSQRKKAASFNCKWCILLLIEHALIIWDKIKTLQVLQQAKKAPDAWSQHETTTQKNKQEKLINLNYFLFLLWWLVLWFLSCRS